MSEVTSSAERTGLEALDAGITALCVDDEPNCLRLVGELLERDDRFEVRTESSPTRALDLLEGVDCIVSDYAMPDMDGEAFFDAARERRPEVPFVLVTSHDRSEVAESILDGDWTDYLQKSSMTDTVDRLPRRVSRLVDQRRIAGLVERTLGPLAADHEGIAIANPAGEFAHVDRTFANRFGYDRESLTGLSWDAIVATGERDRLAATALPIVEEGWRWAGSFEARRTDGEPVTVRTVVAGLDDGTMVLAVCGVE